MSSTCCFLASIFHLSTWSSYWGQLYCEEDSSLFRLLLSGEFVISGFANGDLRARLNHKNSEQMTRLLKRLRIHGLIKRAGKRYRYYLTDFGCRVATLALKLREMVVIPSLAFEL